MDVGMVQPQEAGEELLSVVVNGEQQRVRSRTLAGLLSELGYGEQKVATARNGSFVPARMRDDIALTPNDEIEVVAPRQGG